MADTPPHNHEHEASSQPEHPTTSGLPAALTAGHADDAAALGQVSASGGSATAEHVDVPAPMPADVPLPQTATEVAHDHTREAPPPGTPAAPVPQETPSDVSAASFPVPPAKGGIPPEVDPLPHAGTASAEEDSPAPATSSHEAGSDSSTVGVAGPRAAMGSPSATDAGAPEHTDEDVHVAGRESPTSSSSPTERPPVNTSSDAGQRISADDTLRHGDTVLTPPSLPPPPLQTSDVAAATPTVPPVAHAEVLPVESRHDIRVDHAQGSAPSPGPAQEPLPVSPAMGNMPITADHTGGPAEPALPEQSITAPQTAPAASLEMVTPPTVGTAEPETPTDELPELSYPPETPALPEAVHAGAIIGPDGGEQFRILGERGVSFACRRYEASRVEDDTRVWLDEASTPESMDVLERRKTMLTTVASRFFPRLLGTFTDHERTYLVTEAVPAGTPLLSDVLATDPPSFLHRLTFITQVASALKQLHAQGNVHLGIRPDVVALTRPVKIIDMVYTTSIGTPLSQSYAHPGYSAPELVAGHPADVRADIYSVGALLYTAATGHVLPEAGAPQALFFPGTPRPGVPQILTRCLGRPETRYASMDDLHAALLRLARRDTPPVRHAITGRTEIGLESGRTTNQDALVSLSSTLISEAATEQWSVVVVADGMGGMAAGDVASDRAVHAVVKEAATQFASHPLPTMDEQVQWVRDWMHEANEQVCAAMEQQQARGGCTLVCACVVGQRLTIAHVGDCRIYHIRGAITRLLTRDHSVAMALVLQGEATLSEIRGHPKRSQVTRSLGERHPLQGYQIDTLQQMTGAPTMELEPGDVLLLCSDGLWELVEDEEIGAMVGEHHGDLDLAAHVLINLAMERGGPDNSTALLLRIDRSPANEQG